MSNPLRYCLLVSLATVLSLQAGTFTNDFDSGQPAGTAVYGVAFVDTTGGPDGSGCLKMTSAVSSVSAGFIMDDLDAGFTINAFTARFQVVLGGGNPGTADGFSFNFGDLPDGVISEDGAGSGIRVEFDTYDNGAPDDIGIDVWWNGARIATHPMPLTDLLTWPTYADVLIQLATNGTLNVSFNGTSIYTNLSLAGLVPLQGRFGIGARSGSVNENCWVDNLGVTTSPMLLPYVLSDSPTGANVRPDPIIIVQLHDGAAILNTNSIQMKLNAVSVTPIITQTGAVTTVQYASPPLPSGSSNAVVVTFADSSGSPVNQTNQFGFVVAAYPTLPAGYAATVDTTKPGFTERIFQGSPTTVNSVSLADTMLAGLLLNPANGQPFPNTAQTNTDGTWTYIETSVLNYNLSAPANAGDFPGDVQYPGIPGTTGGTNNFALEAITYLHLTPGTYTFGVNSDDGFRLSSLATQVGIFDAGRPAADTIFSFAVTQTGYYPFRLVHFQGTSLASLEWFSVTSAGQTILINDTNTPGFIPAYSKATSSRPYFLASTPYGTGNRPDKPILVEMQDGPGIAVNTNSIHLLVNGAAVTPSITKTGGVTTVQYSAVWASASANTALVWFADSAVSPVSQTNQFTFSVVAFNNLPTSYAINPASVDTTKPGFLQNVFQTDRTVPSTIAYAEIMLAGQFADAAGNLYPNKATANTDGSHTFAQTNVLNYNVAVPASAGNFTNDTQFPGIPGASGNTNTFALEAITYLYLPVGYYSLGVNSDDGFRLTTAPNPHEAFPYQLAVFDGPRGAADTPAAFGITNAGYYPFRLVYFQASGPASLELFSVAVSGQKILVNDANTTGSIRAYRSANNTQPYVQWAYPYRTGSYFVSPSNPIRFTLVDGTPAIQLNSIQLTINGIAVSPTVARGNGTNIFVSYVPSSFQQTTNINATMQLTYTDANGHITTDAFSFVLFGTEALAPVWNLPPGSRPYLTSDASGGAQECGMGYNPITGHLVVGSISNATTIRGFYILDALTGNDLGQLKQTNSSGVNVFAPASSAPLPGYSVGIADDGAIYAADRESLTFLHTFKIYRWASETDTAYVAFSASGTSLGFNLGYDFRVSGAGKNTQIIAGAGGNNSSSDAVLFTTTDGSNFTATTIGPVSGVNNDLFGGIAFGTNNTFYADGFPGTELRLVGYDPVAKTGSALASYVWTAPSGTFGPLGVDLVNGRVIALAPSTIAGTAHTVNLFDLNALTNSVNSPQDTSYVSTTNANSGGGSVTFTPTGSMAFVLDAENGIMAYELTVKTVTAPSTRITQILYGIPVTISGTGPVSRPFALVSSTNVAKALNLWTWEQTNTAGNGSFTFSVTPGTAKSRFFRVLAQ